MRRHRLISTVVVLVLLAAGAQTAARAATGRPIVFSSDRDGGWHLYTIQPDGSQLRRLTAGAGEDREPAWSPDGRQVVFTRAHGDVSDLYVVNADGSGVRRLTFDPGREEEPAWSPDGAWIAYSSDRSGLNGTAIRYRDGQQVPYRTMNLWSIRPDGSAAHVIALEEGHEAFDPAWSPDSRSIAFSSYDDAAVSSSIRVLDRATGGLRTAYAEDTFLFEPAWSPDGRQIAFRRDHGALTQVLVVAATGSGSARAVTAGRPAATHPSWSPDGRQLLYQSDVDGATYDARGGAVECLAVRETDPRHAVDVCPAGPVPTELWSVRSDGTGAAKVFGASFNVADGAR